MATVENVQPSLSDVRSFRIRILNDQSSDNIVEDGVGRLRNSPLNSGFGVDPGLGIESRRVISKCAGDGRSFGENHMHMHTQGSRGWHYWWVGGFSIYLTPYVVGSVQGLHGEGEGVGDKWCCQSGAERLEAREHGREEGDRVQGSRGAAIGSLLEAFWKRNYLVVVSAVRGVWGLLAPVAPHVWDFVCLSEWTAKFEFLALAAAMVTVGYDLNWLQWTSQ